MSFHKYLKKEEPVEASPLLPDYQDAEYENDEKEHLGAGIYEDELGNFSVTRSLCDGSIADLSVGSILKFADDDDFPFLTPGKEYMVCEVDCDGDVYVTGDDGDSTWVDPSQFNWVSHG